MKKIYLTLGATAAIVTPVASVVACGSKPTTPEVKAKLSDVKYMADWDFTSSFLAKMMGVTGEAKVKLDESLSEVVGIGATKAANTYDVVFMGGPTFTTIDETAGEMLTLDSDVDPIMEAAHNGKTLPKANALPLRDLYEQQYPIMQVQEQFGLMPASFDKERATLKEKQEDLRNIIDFRDRNSKDNSFKTNVERSYQTIRGLIAAGKQVNIIAPSYGAFLAQELIAAHPDVLKMSKHILIDSGRIDYTTNNFGEAIAEHSYPEFSDDGKTMQLASDHIDRFLALDAGAALLKELDQGKTFTTSTVWKDPKFLLLGIDQSLDNQRGTQDLYDKVHNIMTASFVSIRSLDTLNFESVIDKLDPVEVKSKIIFSVADKDTNVGVLNASELAYAKTHFDFISTPGPHMAGLNNPLVINKLK